MKAIIDGFEIVKRQSEAWAVYDATVTPFCFEEDGTPLNRCNDCGVLVIQGDELCGHCYEEQRRAEEWDAMHPELRCPPRE